MIDTVVHYIDHDLIRRRNVHHCYFRSCFENKINLENQKIFTNMTQNEGQNPYAK